MHLSAIHTCLLDKKKFKIRIAVKFLFLSMPLGYTSVIPTYIYVEKSCH